MFIAAGSIPGPRKNFASCEWSIPGCWLSFHMALPGHLRALVWDCHNFRPLSCSASATQAELSPAWGQPNQSGEAGSESRCYWGASPASSEQCRQDEAGIISSFFQLAATKGVCEEFSQSLYNPGAFGIGKWWNQSSPDNHQPLVIPSFDSLCSWTSDLAGGPVLWRGAGTLLLGGQLCRTCSTNCIIEKLFDFSLLSQTLCVLFCSIKGQELRGTMGICQSPRGTMVLPGPGKKASTWKNRELPV